LKILIEYHKNVLHSLKILIEYHKTFLKRKSLLKFIEMSIQYTPSRNAKNKKRKSLLKKQERTPPKYSTEGVPMTHWQIRTSISISMNMRDHKLLTFACLCNKPASSVKMNWQTYIFVYVLSKKSVGIKYLENYILVNTQTDYFNSVVIYKMTSKAMELVY